MKYYNPIIKGFHPDPSICKVGEDYYLVTSTFEYFPGIPLYHSKDLLNWELIGNCIDRAGQLPMEKVKASGGIWAPTIRHDRGIFYITATFSERGNFIISAENPAGPWSDPVWVEMDGIDPSMFFENGEMYYCANDCGSRQDLYDTEGISVAKVDVNTGKVTGEIKRVWEGTGGGFLEAPHVYHIGDWYYILAAEGGTSFNHMVTAARSTGLWGPYEACPDNPILTNRHDTSKHALCCGHADLVEDNSGNWWMVHLGTRPAVDTKSNLGRETFLTPVVWRDGWPQVSGSHKAEIEVEAPIQANAQTDREWSADFSRPEWEHEWLFLKKPQMEHYERKDGKLMLHPTTDRITQEGVSPTFAAVRQKDFACEVEAVLDFGPCEAGDEAGLAVYLTPEYSYRIFKKREEGKDYIIVEKNAGDFKEIVYRKEAKPGKSGFKIKASKEKYEFYYSAAGEAVEKACQASTKFLTCEVAGRCFTGVVIGVYAQSVRDTKAVAYVEQFTQR